MPMNAAKLLLLNVLGGSAADPSASFTAVTSGAQTLTINALTVSAATTVDWGDGSSNVYTGSGARTHNYAGAGTWTVRILEPLNVTAFQLSQSTLVTNVNSASLKRMVNIEAFGLATQPAGSTGEFNIADFADWKPTSFDTYGLPYATVIPAAANFAGWTRCGFLQIYNAGLTSTEVDRVLLGMNMAAASRTATGGSLILSGTNAAPSGTYAAECPPTTGKGAAHNLLNNGCGTINAGRVWSTITVTGGGTP